MGPDTVSLTNKLLVSVAYGDIDLPIVKSKREPTLQQQVERFRSSRLRKKSPKKKSAEDKKSKASTGYRILSRSKGQLGKALVERSIDR